MAQLPFIGKKSKPPALRKDHWAPFATVSFSSGNFGLNIYRKLREFRGLHETCYDTSVVRDTTVRQRKYTIMDQKANSIADLAESIRIEYAEARNRKRVLRTKILTQEKARKREEGGGNEEAWRPKGEARQAQQEGEEKRAEKEKQHQGEKQLDEEQLDKKLQQQKARRWEKLARKKSLEEKKELARLDELLKTKVTVLWKNLLDHEFAAEWPNAVTHGEQWLSDRPYTAPKPWVDPQEAERKKKQNILDYWNRKAERAKAKVAREAERVKAKQAAKASRLRVKKVERARAKEAEEAAKPKEGGGGEGGGETAQTMSELPYAKENPATL